MPRQQSNHSHQQSTSSLKKLVNNLYYIFCGQQQLDPVVNRSIVFNTYMQIVEIVHVIVLYTLFGRTNNNTYNAIQSVIAGLIFALCFVPRLSNKHYSLLVTFIGFLVLTVTAATASVVLTMNYLTFTYYCGLLQDYSVEVPSFVFKAQTICLSVTNLYHLNFIVDGLAVLMHIVYLYFSAKAYGVVKRKYNQEEKRRRRKQKFDENMKNKKPYDPNRKI